MKKSFRILQKNAMFFAFLFSVFFVGCVSKPLPIPGEKSVVIENIYVEYSNIADAYFKLEDYSNAIKYYKLSMENRKLYWQSYYKLAKSYALSSDWTNALPMYEKLLKRDSENSALKASLAYIYSMQGEIEKAVAIYDELLTVESENETYLENYLALLLSSNDFYSKNKEKADEVYKKIETDFPNNKNLTVFDSTAKKYDEKNKKDDSSNQETEENGSQKDESDSTNGTPENEKLSDVEE